MTLALELKKELRKVEQTRKQFETKIVTLKQKGGPHSPTGR